MPFSDPLSFCKACVEEVRREIGIARCPTCGSPTLYDRTSLAINCFLDNLVSKSVRIIKVPQRAPVVSSKTIRYLVALNHYLNVFYDNFSGYFMIFSKVSLLIVVILLLHKLRKYSKLISVPINAPDMEELRAYVKSLLQVDTSSNAEQLDVYQMVISKLIKYGFTNFVRLNTLPQLSLIHI
eukprot:TRINITY_DN6018_c0_g1_i2.p1 TRINITY_DN6018_c0_g1~~TRINITY_DN6018_c0_g1_i2.p1  ORF type:complete len:182 (-),score=8.04 TRINITY_DN6018_c0_g1_i2:60-605(-)